MADREQASEEELALVDDFPFLFQEWEQSEMQSCMGRGITCGKGWYGIIRAQSEELKAYNDALAEGLEKVYYTQIKQKFGLLRVYTSTYHYEGSQPSPVQAILTKYEKRSSKVCERCASEEDIQTSKGWMRVWCRACYEDEAMHNLINRYYDLREGYPVTKYRNEAVPPLDPSEALKELRRKYKENFTYLPEGAPESLADSLEFMYLSGYHGDIVEELKEYAEASKSEYADSIASDFFWRSPGLPTLNGKMLNHRMVKRTLLNLGFPKRPQ